MRALWVIGLALCSSCVSRLDLSDLDRLERSLDARTVALEDDYTLWSPFAATRTADWIAMLNEELAAARGLFGVQPEQRLLIGLVPIDGLDMRVSEQEGKVNMEVPREHPLHGVAGMAGDGRILLYVTPDLKLVSGGAQVIALREPDDYRSTLRHELAHVMALDCGLVGPPWFYEGLADLVQSYALEEGRLVDRGPRDEDLLLAATIPADQWGAARLLDWREDGARIAAGDEAVDKASRALCGLFVRFLVERAPGATIVERLLSVKELIRAQLLSLDPQWRAWLSEAISRVEGGVPESDTGATAKEVEAQLDGASLDEEPLKQAFFDACEPAVEPFESIGQLERGSR
jgi:hypothetical protein